MNNTLKMLESAIAGLSTAERNAKRETDKHCGRDHKAWELAWEHEQKITAELRAMIELKELIYNEVDPKVVKEVFEDK